MRKTWAAVVAALLVPLLALALTSCAADPPRIALGDVVDFWVAPAKASEADAPLYRPSDPLDSIIEAYNQASGDSFYSETTPSLMVQMLLRDVTTIGLSFSSQFPDDHLLVSVSPGDTKEGVWCKVKAPGLLEAVQELAGDHLDRRVLEPARMDWLPD